MAILDESLTLRQWLQREPFTLSMSSGFFGFFAHCGMLAALESEGLVPQKLSGSSAGALVAALWASGLDTKFIGTELSKLKRKDFWDPTLGLGLLSGRSFDSILQNYFPVKTIEECRVPLAISVFDVASRSTRVIQSGDLSSAVRASCAVPLMFQPVRVGKRLSLDGGILDSPGLSGVPLSERILYHHLLPQMLWGKIPKSNAGIPDRPNMRSIVISGLPRVHPFAMERGHSAFNLARNATRKLLDQPFQKHQILHANLL